MTAPPTSNFWGDLVRQLRMSHGWSQRTLSARAKVNRAVLRRIEEGDKDSPIGVMERLLGEMGYELDAIHFPGGPIVDTRPRKVPKQLVDDKVNRFLSMKLKA